MNRLKSLVPATLRTSPNVQRLRNVMHVLFARPGLHINKVGFDVVHGCQLRCVGCPNSTLHTKIEFIAQDVFVKCLQNFDVRHIRLLRLFNFGEPLLHPSLPELLLEIPKQAYTIDDVEISTNAQNHRWDMLAEIFKTGVVTNFVVSCDGEGTAEEYERLRPPATWEKLSEFLTKASELQRQYAPNVRLMTRNICVTDEGQKRWTELLTPLGWTPVFRPWFPFPEASKEWNVPVPKQACKHMYSTNKIYVDIDGTALPCCVHPRAFAFGNLQTQTYRQIMSGMTRKLKFLQLEFRRATMPVCGKCGVV